MQHANDNDKSAPIGAPAERTDAPVPEKTNYAPGFFPVYNRERGPMPRADEWRDSIYSQTHETASYMYTPGICVNQDYSRRSAAEPVPERKIRERSSRLGWFVRAVCLVVICAVFSGVAAYGVMEYRINRGDFTVVNQVVLGGNADTEQNGGLSAPVTVTGTGMSAEDIYTMACTQVVSITTEAENVNKVNVFGNSVPGTATTVTAGSGFIISSDGYILTNYHVIEASSQNDLLLKVCLNDGTVYDAKIIGYEKNNDVAIVKIDASGLNPVTIANSDNIKVGQFVYAVGNPFGELVYTMTDGIVSARDREVSVEGKLVNTFQFSAAVNSGNSGGPLYNTYGEVIGIVTAKPMRNSVEGIGFAIPINDAIAIAAELIEYGYLAGRPLMGISVQTASSAHAEFFGWGAVGAYVTSVTKDSAAEKAGIRIGDIIIALNETVIDSKETLVYTLRRFKAGDTTILSVWRAGEEIVLTITFDEDLSAGQARG